MGRHARSDLLSDGSLSIESWQRDHIDSVVGWIHPDAEWKQWDGPYFPAPSASARDSMATKLAEDPWQRDPSTGLPKRLAICVDGQAIGSVSWHWEDPTSGWVRIGIVIYDPAYWSRGLGTSALRLWVGWLAEQDAVHRIDLVTWSGNERMVRAARSLGMAEEGRLRDARIVRGERHDSVIMGVVTASRIE
ncbi:GNAT family N-acetyltransferase [Solicola gregarius]|uniref:GNAT family N-acetyltransferase n=1 Tax=Solicola gregarius TaxID=2908642 RepID=A0AA46TF94_9ACTN|nr:GNAT family protein [Solicola gregarius]UYM04269.1 GNAT family N-acetyltransferase [Solicola gregarius]